jgi:transcriptional regulator with XRE-family HTH domain
VPLTIWLRTRARRAYDRAADGLRPWEGHALARESTDGSAPEYRLIGDRLRAARTDRRMSLRVLADRVGVSPSLISQVERGRARPSVNTLYTMARELEVSLDELLFVDARPSPHVSTAELGPITPSQPVQRAGDRKSIRLASGVTWERLTTESIPKVDFLYVTYEVGGASSPEHEFQRHGGQEWGYVLSGRLGVTVGFDDHLLGPGDAIALDHHAPGPRAIEVSGDVNADCGVLIGDLVIAQDSAVRVDQRAQMVVGVAAVEYESLDNRVGRARPRDLPARARRLWAGGWHVENDPTRGRSLDSRGAAAQSESLGTRSP